MSNVQLFNAVGIAKDPVGFNNHSGKYKLRFSKEIVLGISLLTRGQCTIIKMQETPKAMTKLEASEWYYDNNTMDLTLEEEDVVLEKIYKLKKQHKTTQAKQIMQENIKTNVKENKKTDPRVQAFIEKELQAS